jgi:hypothetical protein
MEDFENKLLELGSYGSIFIQYSILVLFVKRNKIKEDIKKLEYIIDIIPTNYKKRNLVEYLYNNIDNKYHYLLRSKRLQKHFNIDIHNEHSDRYKLKDFFANESNQNAFLIGGVTSLFSFKFGALMTLSYKIGHKIANELAIYEYIKENR